MFYNKDVMASLCTRKSLIVGEVKICSELGPFHTVTGASTRCEYSRRVLARTFSAECSHWRESRVLAYTRSANELKL